MLQVEQGRETGSTLVCRIEGQLRGGSAAGMSTGGASFVNDLDATIVAGLLAGTRLTRLERFTLRPDGVALVAGPKTIETDAGSVSISLVATSLLRRARRGPGPRTWRALASTSRTST